MKKIAFTCSACGTLNIPLVSERWSGYSPCQICGSMELVTTRGEGRTAPGVYGAFAKKHGLPVPVLFQLQKRGLVPRDLACCNPAHLTAVGAVALAIASEEILRAALASLPKVRRERLLHPVASDGLLAPWQRDVLNHYVRQFQFEREYNPTRPGEEGRSFGSSVTTIPEMILYVEDRYGLPAATTRVTIRRLKKIAYNRVRRGAVKTGGGKS